MPRLTALIITLNEAAHIAAAVESVAWADEVLVVDSHSTDGTAELARKAGARVEVRDWPGYVEQKNSEPRAPSTTGSSRSTPTSV